MASSVGLSSECVDVYQELRLKKKHRYVIYKINDAHDEIVVDRTSESSEWDEFLCDLPQLEPRYAVYNLEYEPAHGDGVKNKICFVKWSPDGARIKSKMMYASAQEAIKRALQGIQIEVQATDLSEVEYDNVIHKARGAVH